MSTRSAVVLLSGGLDLDPICAEITYGLERLCAFLQDVDSLYDVVWARNPRPVTYGDLLASIAGIARTLRAAGIDGESPGVRPPADGGSFTGRCGGDGHVDHVLIDHDRRDQQVPVGQLLQRGYPSERDLGEIVLLDLPHDLLLRRHFDHAVAVAGRDQRIAVL